MRHILKCSKCGGYTLNKKCRCGGIAATIKPPKYSVEDKYAKYRREIKRKEREEAGIL
ncbi:ribosome biogenesis protein [Candidatus Woesearchaeota archaeon]|nr:MAG: ribosome biogenesis protein [Candidatus Woesearchaeota archaeon]